MGTLGTLGQHEFAFRFCGSTRSLAAGIHALRALLLFSVPVPGVAGVLFENLYFYCTCNSHVRYYRFPDSSNYGTAICNNIR